MTTHKPPAIVLVRPQLGENIGMVARAMANCGLADLKLVAPRDGWPNPAAVPAAAGADFILKNATCHDTLREAVSDCRWVHATTARKRKLCNADHWPMQTPRQAAKIWQDEGAILFGPENAGLTNNELALANLLIKVPMAEDFSSLNLAQAVLICAYEWRLAALSSSNLPDSQTSDNKRASKKDIDRFWQKLNSNLEAKGHYPAPDRKEIDAIKIQQILHASNWSQKDLQTLYGVLTTLTNENVKS